SSAREKARRLRPMARMARSRGSSPERSGRLPLGGTGSPPGSLRSVLLRRTAFGASGHTGAVDDEPGLATRGLRHHGPPPLRGAVPVSPVQPIAGPLYRRSSAFGNVASSPSSPCSAAIARGCRPAPVGPARGSGWLVWPGGSPPTDGWHGSIPSPETGTACAGGG